MRRREYGSIPLVGSSNITTFFNNKEKIKHIKLLKFLFLVQNITFRECHKDLSVKILNTVSTDRIYLASQFLLGIHNYSTSCQVFLVSSQHLRKILEMLISVLQYVLSLKEILVHADIYSFCLCYDFLVEVFNSQKNLGSTETHSCSACRLSKNPS